MSQVAYGTGGTVLPFTDGADQRHVQYVAAIERWVAERRADDTLTVEEFRQLDDGSKLVALFRSQLLAVARWYRQHPRENAAPGVLMAIHYLADNPDGCCTMAQERIGRLFGRGRPHINDCIAKLEESGDIRVERLCGLPARIYPIVARALAKSGNKIWLFDAMAPEIGRRGRPKKPVVATATPFSENVSSKSEKPVVVTATQKPFEFPEEDRPHLLLTAQELTAIRDAADAWGRKRGDPGFNPLPLQTVEREVLALQAEAQLFSAEIIRAAFMQALNELLNRKANAGSDWASALAYFRKAFRTALADRAAPSPKQPSRVSQVESPEQRRKQADVAFTMSQRGKGRAVPAEDGPIDMRRC